MERVKRTQLSSGDRQNLFDQLLVDARVEINEPARLYLDRGRLHLQPTCDGGCVALLPPTLPSGGANSALPSLLRVVKQYNTPSYLCESRLQDRAWIAAVDEGFLRDP
jgi:hypothetical protein